MHNTNGVRPDCRELLEISQQKQISETKIFCTINALDVWKTYVCKSTVSKMKQVKSKNRNRKTDKTEIADLLILVSLLIKDDRVREASTRGGSSQQG